MLLRVWLGDSRPTRDADLLGGDLSAVELRASFRYLCIAVKPDAVSYAPDTVTWLPFAPKTSADNE
jgi:hypothetical protein